MSSTTPTTHALPLELDLSTVNMAIRWASTGELDIYFANMTVETKPLHECGHILEALREGGVTVVDMD